MCTDAMTGLLLDPRTDELTHTAPVHLHIDPTNVEATGA